MGTAWATAFVVAAALALAGTPLLRRLAITSGFLDHPGERKGQRQPVAYLGGIAIIGGAVIGLTIDTRTGSALGVSVFGACVIGATGLVDDHRHLSARTRLAVQVVVAVLMVVDGISLHVVEQPLANGLLTIVWIVGITNAFNLLDNMDGLAAGVATAVALGVFTLAAVENQDVVAVLAAGLAGACVGFLAYNVRPATIYMGDAGSLFLGFTLSLAVLELRTVRLPPESILVPLFLLAVPLLDTTTVTLARLRHGRAVTQGGRDHLSHRLARRGLAPGVAVTVLVLVQAVCSVAAVAVGSGAPSAGWAAGLALGLVVLVLAAAVPARVYTEATVGLPRRLVLTGLVSAVLVAATVSPGAIALAAAREPLSEGARLAQLGIRYAERGDEERATAAFEASIASFDRAGSHLDRTLVSAGLAYPMLAANLRAARTLADLGSSLSQSGADLAETVDPEALRIRAGHVPVEELERVAPELERRARELNTDLAVVEGIDTDELIEPLRSSVLSLRRRLERTATSAHRAAEGARLLPALTGAHGRRRYFLAVENNAELRATGGFIGNWGVLTADGGDLELERFRRLVELNDANAGNRVLNAPEDFVARYGRFGIETTWQNVNMSPDFPTDAAVMADLFLQSGGEPVDGVIAIDPPGLAAILRVTGPVKVPSWPTPITAEDVVDVTLRQAYEHFPLDERVEFLGDVADAVWDVFTTKDLPRPGLLARELGRAVHQKHLLLYSSHPEEQALFDAVGASGRVRPLRGDALLLVNQNAAGNKIDYYLERSIELDVLVEPNDTLADGTRLSRSNTADVEARLRARLASSAPASGLSTTAIGPYSSAFAAGENRSFVSVYTPLGFDEARVDGAPVGMESARELGRSVYSRFVSIPAGSARTLELDMAGIVALEPGGWYTLDLGRQPTLHPDRTRVSISVPPGWGITGVRNAERAGDRTARAHLRLDSDQTIQVRIERSDDDGFWDGLR